MEVKARHGSIILVTNEENHELDKEWGGGVRR
jgi:hypothetical protein